MFKMISAMLLILVPGLSCGSDAVIDEVIVDKSSRSMWLVSDSDVQFTFKISLGPNPEHHKQYVGDGRTPEGKYRLTWKNDQSQFYKAFHINYPNSTDRALSQRINKHPGGNIKIHGLPNNSPFGAKDHLAFDWTDGCIAVSNKAMDIIWSHVPEGTPIYIYSDLSL